jgi:hypothetical protein
MCAVEKAVISGFAGIDADGAFRRTDGAEVAAVVSV